MSKLYLINGQNVRIRPHLAGLGLRIVAQIIDWVALSVVSYVIIAAYLLCELHRYVNDWLWIICTGLLFVLYMPLCEVLFNGQTFGKWCLHIRVVRLDGQPLTVGGSFLRFLILPIDAFLGFGIGCVMIAFSPRSQRLGDLAAGTTVINDRAFVASRVDLSDYNYLLEDYKPRYARASELSQKQADIIDHVLQAEGADRSGRIELLARKVEAVCGPPDQKDRDLPEYYLFHILNDWRYYQLDPDLVGEA